MFESSDSEEEAEEEENDEQKKEETELVEVEEPAEDICKFLAQISFRQPVKSSSEEKERI